VCGSFAHWIDFTADSQNLRWVFRAAPPQTRLNIICHVSGIYPLPGVNVVSIEIKNFLKKWYKENVSDSPRDLSTALLQF